MKNKFSFSFLLIFLFIGLFLVGQIDSVWAQYVPPPYGEIPPAGQILMDKKIKNPQVEKGGLVEFVDNLGPQDYHFSPGEEVNFKIKIQNTGETTFEKIEVKDILPPYVEFVSGTTRVEYEDVKADEVREFGLKVKVVSADKLPNNQGLYCVINKAEVIADDQTDEDTAQLCIEKKVLGAAIQPEAGVNLFSLTLGFLSLSIFGFILEKKLKATS